MSRLIVSVVLCSAALSFATPAEEPANAVTLRLGSGGLIGLSTLGGLGVLGLSTPEGGASYERAFGHLSVVLALDASAAFNTVGESLTTSLEPGVRWTFGERRLSGPWVGVAVPLSLRRSSAVVSALDALGGLEPRRVTATTFGFGADALAGWSFCFDNGFFAQLAAGPRISTQRFSAMPDSVQLVPASTISLRAFASLGAAF